MDHLFIPPPPRASRLRKRLWQYAPIEPPTRFVNTEWPQLPLVQSLLFAGIRNHRLRVRRMGYTSLVQSIQTSLVVRRVSLAWGREGDVVSTRREYAHIPINDERLRHSKELVWKLVCIGMFLNTVGIPDRKTPLLTQCSLGLKINHYTYPDSLSHRLNRYPS